MGAMLGAGALFSVGGVSAGDEVSCDTEDYACQIVDLPTTEGFYLDFEEPIEAGEAMGEVFGPFGQRLVDAFYVGGLTRLYSSMEGDVLVAFQLVDYSSARYVRGLTQDQPGAAGELTSLYDAARAFPTDPPTGEWTNAGVRLPVEHMVVDISVFVHATGGRSLQRAELEARDLLLSVAEEQLGRMKPAADREEPALSGDDFARDMAELLLRLVLTGVLVLAVSSLTDRGRRQVIASAFRRKRPCDHKEAVSVAGSAAAMRRRALAVAVVGVGGFAGGMWTGFHLRSVALIPTGGFAGWAVATTVARRLLLGRRVSPAAHSRNERLALPRAFGRQSLWAGLSILLIACSAAFFLNFGVMIAWAGIAPPGGLWSARELSRVASASLLVGIVLLALVRIPVRLLERRYRFAIASQVDRDDRQPTVMLRSFADDRLRIWARRALRHSVLDRLTLRRRELFEEPIAWRAWRLGPVVAFGEPGKPPSAALGAARSYYNHWNWQPAVEQLIATARALIVIVGDGDGLGWEIEAARRSRSLGSTLFVLPPLSDRARHRRYMQLAGALDGRIPHTTPRSERVVAVFVDGNGAPTMLTCPALDDAAYDAALDWMVCAVESHQPEQEHTTVDALLSGARTIPSGQVSPPPGTGRWSIGIAATALVFGLWYAALEQQPEPDVFAAYPDVQPHSVALPGGPTRLATDGRRIWTTSGYDLSIRTIDVNLRVEDIDHSLGGARTDIAATGDYVMVTDSTDASFALFDSGTRARLATGALKSAPMQVASDGATFMVTLPATGSIVHIDPANPSSPQTFVVGGAPWAVSSLAEDEWVVVDGSSGAIVTLDTGQDIKLVDVQGRDGHLRSVDAQTGSVIAADYVDAAVLHIVGDDVHVHDLPDQPSAISFWNDKAVVVTNSGLLILVDLPSGAQTTYRFGSLAHDILIVEDLAWISQPLAGEIVIVDLSSISGPAE